jgi:hypothetical protein
MIAFDVECSQGHIFEGWFNNIESFEEQKAKKLVSCPYCNDTDVRKVISPVAMRTSSPKTEEGKDLRSIDYPRLAREVVDYINKNFHDVGADFTKEALKMHYGATEKRNIRGSATDEEEKVLKEEGIEFFRVPIPKIDDEKKN